MLHRRLHGCVALVGLLVCVGAAGAKPARPPATASTGPSPIEAASWIWDVPAAIKNGAEECYFRRVVELPAKPAKAFALVTADNGYELHVNGALVGGEVGMEADYWQSIERYDIRNHLVAGKNVIGFLGKNLGGPAGLIFAVRVDLPDGKTIEIVSDDSWKANRGEEAGWATANHDDTRWAAAAVLGKFGMQPWGKLASERVQSPPRVARAAQPSGKLTEPGEGFAFPTGIVFLRGAVPQQTTRNAQSLWMVHRSRAYFEHDVPAPPSMGRQLLSLVPARPDGKTTVLLDAGTGVIGPPSVTHDGRTVLFTHCPAGQKWLRIYAINADGSGLRCISPDAPVHDYDPEPLPDGRIVFSSTRLGSREEYHGNMASSLFVMDGDGGNVRPLTFHIVSDREPRVAADGTIVFVRSDNFLERAKVETQIHQVLPDGRGGFSPFQADRSAIAYDRQRAAEGGAAWLRNHGFGCPAPLSDGGLAAIGREGLLVSRAGGKPARIPAPLVPFDISPLPDGRLLCTDPSQAALGVVDLPGGNITRIFSAPDQPVQAPAFLGPRARPPAMPAKAMEDEDPHATGYLYCQNLFLTRQTNADLARVKAVRIYEGRPLAIRAARHSYGHIGVEAVELGSVPLAPDGSFYVRVPANRALAMQAVDAEGRTVVNEMSWVYVRPNEQRSCIGCHNHSSAAPPSRAPSQAMQAAPLAILGQGRPLRFRGNNAANGGVLNLQLERFREHAHIDLFPLPGPDAKAEAQPGRPAEVAALKHELTAGATPQKISAAARLAVFRDRAGAGDLAGALGDPSVEVRTAAALALSACGTRQSLDPLLKALEDQSPLVAQAAHIALENLTGASVAFDAFASRPAGAGAWADWRRQNDWPAVEKGLIERLAATSALIVMRAVEALGHIGGDAARESLRAYLTKNAKTGEVRVVMAAMRALGHLQDRQAVPLLAELLNVGVVPRGGGELGQAAGPVYVTATAAEALGWIGGAEAEKALLALLPQLTDFWKYSHQTADHSWLMGCHASPIHYRVLEALDAMGCRELREVAPIILKSVPIDSDRGLLLENDGYEILVGRLMRRAGLADAIAQTCLSVLDDANAKADPALLPGVTASPPASSTGALDPKSRAAQVLSLVCADPTHAPAVRTVLQKTLAMPDARPRAWTSFFLARALGNMRDEGSLELLKECLTKHKPEAALGLIAPPNVFSYAAMTPFHRSSAAYALARLGKRESLPILLQAVGDWNNALDVRHSAARAAAMLAGDGDENDLLQAAEKAPEVSIRRLLLGSCKPVPRRGTGR